MEQLTLDLFAADKPARQTPLEYFLDWAHRVHKCGHEIDEIAARLFDTMPDAFDRGKALVTASGHGGFDQFTVDALGLFDTSLDYHVCWDRAWAHRHGVPIELIPRIHRCDYRCGSGRHRFHDEDGELVYETNKQTRGGFDGRQGDREGRRDGKDGQRH